MAKLIDADETVKAIIKRLGIGSERYFLPSERAIVDVIESMPTVDTELVQRGHWRTDKVAFYNTCSVCGCCIKQDTLDVLLDYYGKYNFCPNCGAKMDGEEE